MGPANNIIYLLQHVSAVMSKQLDNRLKKELGIGLSQYRLLMVLEWNPRLQQNAIASSLGQSEASISRQIKILINKGLLSFIADPKNKKRHICTPSTKGMQINEAALIIIRQYFSNNKALESNVSIDNLLSDLKKLHSVVCKRGQIGACNHLLGI